LEFSARYERHPEQFGFAHRVDIGKQAILNGEQNRSTQQSFANISLLCKSL
jgi:hypothetical protein